MPSTMFLKYVLRYFLPFAIAFALGGYWLLQDIKHKQLDKLDDVVNEHMSVGKTSVNDKLHLIIRDILYISDGQLLSDVINLPQDKVEDSPNLSALAHDWIALMSAYQIYDQIRWLGPDGKERLRINNTKNGPERVANNNLQNKSDRYYFSMAKNLKPNQFYISPFDLNKENGKLEFPRKPMFRLAKPVVDSKGQNQGVIVLNCLGDDLLNSIKERGSSKNTHIWLNNEQGYWLLGSKPEDEWGFMFDKPKMTLKEIYPKSWQKITSKESGSFSNEQGFWNFDTVRPMQEAALVNLAKVENIIVNDLPQLDKEAFSSTKNNPYFWKIVSFTPQKQINHLVFMAQVPVYIGLVILFLILLMGSILWARVRMAKDLVVENLYDSNQKLEKTTHQLEVDIAAKIVAQRELGRSVERYSGVLNASMDGFVLMDKTGVMLECNQAFVNMLALQHKTLEGCPFTSLFDDQQKQIVLEYLADINHKKYNQFQLLNHVLDSKDNKKVSLEFSLSYVESTQQICVFIRDITVLKENEFSLKMAASVFTYAKEGIILTNQNFDIVDVNAEFSFITGYSREEVIGKKTAILSSKKHTPAFYIEIKQTLLEKGHWYGEVWQKRKTGEPFLEFLTITQVVHPYDNSFHYISMFTDITLEKQLQKRLQHNAHYDSLTNLPNRFLLTDRINQAMVTAKRNKKLMALIFIDLDGFKKVNDELGHYTGDSMLIHVSRKMKQALRESDTVARIGGDEFVAVVNDLHSVDEIEPILQKMLKSIAIPLIRGDKTIQVGGSLGVTFYPQATDLEGEQLIRQADQAMYEAKQLGKNCFHFFNVQKDNATRDLLKNIGNIQHGLYNQEFVLHYQPKVALCSDKVIGVEALIRWQHPARGLLYPIDFLPFVERTELAIKLSEWVIHEALSQIERWQEQGLNIPISINIGAKELQQDYFMDWLNSLLKQHPNVEPKMLEIEVLETSALEDVTRISELINQAKEQGISFALDDFGTGFASLSYLKRLPIETIKIDQSFIRNMFEDQEDFTLLEGLIGLTKSLHRKVVAEGIETEQHGSMLIELGCTYGQGYFIAKPMVNEKIPQWIKHWKRPKSWLEQLNFAEQEVH